MLQANSQSPVVDIIGVKDDPSLETLNDEGDQGTSCGVPNSFEVGCERIILKMWEGGVFLENDLQERKPTQTSSGSKCDTVSSTCSWMSYIQTLH